MEWAQLVLSLIGALAWSIPIYEAVKKPKIELYNVFDFKSYINVQKSIICIGFNVFVSNKSIVFRNMTATIKLLSGDVLLCKTLSRAKLPNQKEIDVTDDYELIHKKRLCEGLGSYYVILEPNARIKRGDIDCIQLAFDGNKKYEIAIHMNLVPEPAQCRRLLKETNHDLLRDIEDILIE